MKGGSLKLLAVAAAGLACLLAVSHVSGQMGTSVATLNDDCAGDLQRLWSNYTNPARVPIDGCDKECLLQCKEILEDALYSDNVKNCPHQTDIVRCFHVYSDQWEEFAKECALFSFGGDAFAEAEAGRRRLLATEGEADASPSPEAEASPSPEAEAEASPSPEAEAEASPSPAAEASPAPESSSSSSSAEGEVSASGTGCFPYFATVEQFEEYIDGQWFEEHYHKPSNAVGVTMCVLFFAALVGLGVLLRS